MFDGRKIAFIGAGVMAEAMISGLIRNKLASGESLLASDPRSERLDELHRLYGRWLKQESVRWCLIQWPSPATKSLKRFAGS